VSADDVSRFLEVSRLETSLEEYALVHGDWAVKEYETSGLLQQPELTDIGWLNLAELEANLAHREIEPGSLSPPVRAALAAMAELGAAYGREDVRLVFWIGL
jgi:hypothetical protein